MYNTVVIHHYFFYIYIICAQSTLLKNNISRNQILIFIVIFSVFFCTFSITLVTETWHCVTQRVMHPLKIQAFWHHTMN